MKIKKVFDQIFKIYNIFLKFFSKIFDEIEKIIVKIKNKAKRLFNKKKNDSIEQDF